MWCAWITPKPSPHLQSVKKLSSTKPFPGAKSLGTAANGTSHFLGWDWWSWAYLVLGKMEILPWWSQVWVIFTSTAEPGPPTGTEHVLCRTGVEGSFIQNKPVAVAAVSIPPYTFPHISLDRSLPLLSCTHPLIPVESHIFKKAMPHTLALTVASPSFLLNSFPACSVGHRVQPSGMSWLMWCLTGRLEASWAGTMMSQSLPSMTYWPINFLRTGTCFVLFTKIFSKCVEWIDVFYT